jgi:hypothetical protein
MSENPLSIEEQAGFLDAFIRRCTMMDGVIADETVMRLEKGDVLHLIDIANRLQRMAPHEDKIRRMVMGR